MSISATQIQLLRSSILNNRPNPGQLLDGQPSVNINAGQPGVFFKDNNGGLFKVGPTSVGLTPPNTNGTGSTGNSLGELWFDTGTAELKVWDGLNWRPADPSELGFSVVLIQASAPDVLLYPNGTLWWNDGNGQMYVLYEDNDGRQWVQVGAGGGGGSGAVIISEQQPDPVNSPVGSLWWNDATGSLFILYNDGGPEKLWVQIAGAGAISQSGGGSVTSIQTGTGLSTLNGQPITTQGTIILKAATATEIGGVKPGPNVLVAPDGTISFVGDGSGTVTQIQTAPGITGGPITTTGTIGLASATNTQIGGVKPGVGLGVNGDGTIFVTPATNGQLGGVSVGAGLSITASGALSADVVPPGSVPAGMVQWFAGPLVSIPTGWKYCNGETLLIDNFPALHNAIGRIYSDVSTPVNSFKIPDLRGQFLRGWDNRATGGTDDGRIFGSYQNDEFKSHTHTYTDNLGPGFGLTFTGNSAAQDNTTSATGGSETRPKNVAMLPIIKV
jgi:microcystin-dependent protein